MCIFSKEWAEHNTKWKIKEAERMLQEAKLLLQEWKKEVAGTSCDEDN